MFVVYISQLFSISWLENISAMEKKKKRKEKKYVVGWYSLKEVCCWLDEVELWGLTKGSCSNGFK